MEVKSQIGGLAPQLIDLLQNRQSSNASRRDGFATASSPPAKEVMPIEDAAAIAEGGRVFPRGSFVDILA